MTLGFTNSDRLRDGTVTLRCVWCGTERAPDLRPFCLRCGGTLEISGNPTPSLAKATSLWGFAETLPVPPRITLGEGGTPLLRLGRLAADDEVYGKAEWTNPTGAFKDRGSAVAVSAAVELGAEGIVCASTGNNAASVSAYAARAGLPCLVVLPVGTSPAKAFQARLHGATVIEVAGTFSDAHRLAVAVTELNARWPNLTSTFVNPYMTAAHMTIAYEVAADLEQAPGTIIVPIGAGPMLVGIIDGLSRLVDAGVVADGTTFVGVQASGCAPIVRAFETGAEEVTAWTGEVASCAGSINDALVGYPSDGTRTLRAVRRVGGIVVGVSDAEILSAMYDFGSIEGIGCEPAAAAPLAALRLLEKDRGKRLPRPVVLVCSGHALKDTDVKLPIRAAKVQHDANPRELLELASRNARRGASYGERRGSAV